MAIKIAVIDDSVILNRWLEANLPGTEFEVKTLSDSSKAEEFIRETQRSADGYIVKSNDPADTVKKIRQFLESKTVNK